MAVSTGTSLALSTLLSVLLFAGMQMYNKQLASTEWLTIVGGLLGSGLFIFSLTAFNNLEVLVFGKGFQAKIFPEGSALHSKLPTCAVCTAATMTKLSQWLSGLTLLGTTWVALNFDLLGLDLLPTYKQVIWPLPVYLLMAFGCYSLATIGYRVATFNDCEDAAKELQEQIKEAKKDLTSKGLKF